MTKEELLEELSLKINSGEISREDLTSRFNFNSVEVDEKSSIKRFTNFSLNKLLYVLGAVILIIGLVIFIYQVWDDIGKFGHIVVTLGLGLLTTFLGSVLTQQKPGNEIGAVFQTIGGALIPGGSMVFLNELDLLYGASNWPVSITFGLITVFYIALSFFHKHPILTFFSIANGTAFIYSLMESVLEGPSYLHGDEYVYLTMLVGLSYLLVAKSFEGNWNKRLIGLLYFFGSAFFYGAAFSKVYDSMFWELSFFIFVLGGLFLSVYMKSRIILVMSTLFLLGHLSHITNEYFADSLGWPIALILLGFVFMILGYLSVEISRKYIQTSK